MVNNNTSQNTVKVTTTQSESSIYLKRSELPKNLSSFKNDVGYISSTALDLWMKDHSYLSRDEITELINNARLVVVKNVNTEFDRDAIERLNNDVLSIKSELRSIKENLTSFDGSFISSDKEGQFATKGDIRTVNNNISNITTNISQIRNEISQIDTTGFAKTSDVPTKVSQLQNDKNYITQSALTGYAKSSDLKKYAKVDDIPTVPDVSGFITRNELPATPTGLATQTWVKNQKYLTKQSVGDFAKKSDLDKFVTVDEIDALIDTTVPTDTSNFVQKSDLSGYVKTNTLNKYLKKSDYDTSDFATQEWVNAQGFLKDAGDTSEFARKTDLDKYVSKTSLTSTLSKYAKSSEVYTKGDIDTTYLKKDDAANAYLTKKDASSTYIPRAEVRRDYLKIEDYRGLRDATVINDTYKRKPLSDLQNDIDQLQNGFYVVENNKVVLVKKDGEGNRDIIKIYNGEGGEAFIRWEEDRS